MSNDALLVLLVVGFQPVTTDCHTDKQLEHFAEKGNAALAITALDLFQSKSDVLIKSMYIFKALFLFLLIISNIVDFCSFIFLPLWYRLNQPNDGEGTEWEKRLEDCQEK